MWGFPKYPIQWRHLGSGLVCSSAVFAVAHDIWRMIHKGAYCVGIKSTTGKYTIHDKLTQSSAPNYMHTYTRAHMPTCCWWSSYLRVIFFIIRMSYWLFLLFQWAHEQTQQRIQNKSILQRDECALWAVPRRICEQAVFPLSRLDRSENNCESHGQSVNGAKVKELRELSCVYLFACIYTHYTDRDKVKKHPLVHHDGIPVQHLSHRR